MKSRGDIVRAKQVGPFRLVEKSYLPGRTLPLHEHERAYASFLLAGAYVEVSRREERVCCAGTVIWHPQTEVHADRFHAAGGHLLDLEIDSAWLDEARHLQPIAVARIFSGGLPYWLGLRMYRELGSQERSFEDAATELLSYFFTAPFERKPPAWFNRALQACSDVERRPSLAEMAAAVGVHPVHLARSFRRFLGCTFGDYLSEVRIRRAFDLLRGSKGSLADVSYTSGFADQAHLCRTFKKVTGLTPTALRTILRPSPHPSK